MQRTIRKVVYDTDAAALIGKKCVGEFGQADGYEEQLFETESGHFFLYGIGGPESIYEEPKIKPLGKDNALKWKAENGIG